MTDDHKKLLMSYSVSQLLASGMRFVGDYEEETAIEHYLELHPEANEADVRAKLYRDSAAPIHEHLIDPRSTPISSIEKIAAELEELRRLPASVSRDHTIQMLEEWIEEKKVGPQRRRSDET